MLQTNRKVKKSEIESVALDERMEMEAHITDTRAQELNLQKFENLSSERYWDANAWRRYVANFIGDVRGKRVLDICCGYSMTPVLFALAGAEVTAVDVSPLSLEKVKQVADLRGVGERVSTHCGPGEELPFEDNSFDIIYGGAAIHHLMLDQAGLELSRVLATGGKGAFQDPLGHNIFIEFIRDNLNYPGKHQEKGIDLPLTLERIEVFGPKFKSHSWRGFNLLAGLLVAFPGLKKYRKTFEKFDEGILKIFPFLHKYSRFSVVCVNQ